MIWKVLRRSIPLVVLGAIIVSFYLFGGFDLISWDNFVLMREELLDHVGKYPYYVALIFALSYTVYTLSSIPGIILLDLVGGFLFPQPISTLLVLISGTLGGLMTFLATKHAVGQYISFKKEGVFFKIKTGFERHRKSYLLFMRLVPIFPIGIVNIALGLLNIPTRLFLWTTFLGFLPPAFIFTQVGSGLGEILSQEGPFTFSSLLNPQIVMALIGLAIISILPIFFKKSKAA